VISFFREETNHWKMFLIYVFIFFGFFFVLRNLFFSPKSDINPAGKPIFVTGAASGIGRATVQDLLSKHAFVFASDVNEEALREAFGNNSNVRIIHLDVTSQKSMDDAVSIVRKEGRGLYGVVNCAGIVGKNPAQVKCGAETHVEDEARITIEINLLGTMRVCHGLLDFILESKGVIVNITSVLGRVALPGGAIYCTTKHALNGYTASIRRELKPKGVRVIAIEPGGVRTPLLMNSALIVEPDFSHTKILTKGLRNQIGELRKIFESIQEPERVANEITRVIFTSSNNFPHLVVDFFYLKIGWIIISCLPHGLVDFFLDFTRRRE